MRYSEYTVVNTNVLHCSTLILLYICIWFDILIYKYNAKYYIIIYQIQSFCILNTPLCPIFSLLYFV